jgi:predicted transcriptional regulator
MTHELKIWPQHFAAVVSGVKKYEVRRNDRVYKVGDEIHLREWDPEPATYTGRFQLARIIHVTDSASWEFIPIWITIFGIELLHGGSDGQS